MVGRTGGSLVCQQETSGEAEEGGKTKSGPQACSTELGRVGELYSRENGDNGGTG